MVKAAKIIDIREIKESKSHPRRITDTEDLLAHTKITLSVNEGITDYNFLDSSALDGKKIGDIIEITEHSCYIKIV